MKNFRFIFAVLAITFGAIGCGNNNGESPEGDQPPKDTVSSADRTTSTSPATVPTSETEPPSGTSPAPGSPPPVRLIDDAMGFPDGRTPPTSAPIRPSTAPAPVMNGWSYCANAYQALADAVADEIVAGPIPPAEFSQTMDDGSIMSFYCHPLNATPALVHATIRYGGNDIQRCWNSDPLASSGWPSGCRHPQKIADDIATSEAEMTTAGFTDELMVDGRASFNGGTGIGFTEARFRLHTPGFSVSGIPYFLVQAPPSPPDPRLPEAGSIRFLRAYTPPDQTRTVFNNYYTTSQLVVCVNTQIASIAAACR